MEFNQKLLFVTGKGGTGKSFLASILGVRYAEQGKKVLLIDAEASGGLAEQFEHGSVGYEPVEVARNIFILESNTDDALSQYLHLYAKIPTWAKISPLARMIDLVANAAPGVKEILITGKICFEVKKLLEGESDFDIIIVDSPSSGHVISLLDAPRALAEIVSRGIIQAQTKWMQDILHDDETTGVVIATTTDEVVLAETHDLIGKIETDTDVHIAGIVINKDIADLGNAHMPAPHISKPSSIIDRAHNYYAEIINQTRDVVGVFEQYPLYAFPFIAEPIPTLRALIKNEPSFVRVDAGVS